MELFIVEDMDPSSPRIGGVASYSRQLLEFLGKAGIKATLLGVRNGNGFPVNDMATLVPIVRRPKFTGYEYLLRLMIKTPFLQIPESAIIHAQHPEYMFPFALFHRKNPKILTIHGQVLEKIRLKRKKAVRFVYKLVEAFVLRRSNVVIVVDEFTGDFYQRHYPWMVKPRLIPTGIDLGKFKLLDRDVLRPKYGFQPDDKIVAYVGRLEKEKGPDFLLDCSVLLAELVPEALTLLVGDGRDREYLMNKVSLLNLERVIFMGAVEPDTIPEIMNCADVLALCSLYEGSPTVVKEALACGVPVVSTDAGDVRDVLQDERTGRIVPRNKEDFTSALAGMLLVPDREAVRSVCSASAAKYGFDQVGARTVALYRELSGEQE